MFIDWGKHAAENYRVMLLEEMHANANCCQLCTIFPRMAAFGSNLVDHRGAMAEALPNPKPTALSGPELLKAPLCWAPRSTEVPRDDHRWKTSN